MSISYYLCTYINNKTGFVQNMSMYLSKIVKLINKEYSIVWYSLHQINNSQNMQFAVCTVAMFPKHLEC